jgi:hypothetical protein
MIRICLTLTSSRRLHVPPNLRPVPSSIGFQLMLHLVEVSHLRIRCRKTFWLPLLSFCRRIFKTEPLTNLRRAWPVVVPGTPARARGQSKSSMLPRLRLLGTPFNRISLSIASWKRPSWTLSSRLLTLTKSQITHISLKRRMKTSSQVRL